MQRWSHVAGMVCTAWLGTALAPLAGAEPDVEREPRSRIEQVIVTGERPEGLQGPTPRSYISALDAAGINVSTVEDFLTYEPSLIVRRRFIGDPNGTLGIRGSNQFQTTRAMVFADGLPLHYLLQSRFSGAPRWSLVSPDEVLGVEVLYGPFSAEYGGNSMGGVVNIETSLPERRSFHLETTGFRQDFDELGTDESYLGGRVQASYGDRFGNLSVYLSHNHLQNDSQPMSFLAASPSGSSSAATLAGGELGRDATGAEVLYFGDSGAEEAATDLTKLKLGYTWGDWLARMTVAYEQRERDVKAPSSFLRDPATGDRSFAGGTVSANGQLFAIDSSEFGTSNQDRRTRLVGLGLDGPLGGGFDLELDVSRFEILEDESENADFLGSAGADSIAEFDDTGWVTFDAKVRAAQPLGLEPLRLVVGYHYDRYELKRRSFDTSSGGKELQAANASGGTTSTQAGFAQVAVQLDDQWDVEAGLRYETWRSEDGFFGTTRHAGRRESGWSPKASLGYAPGDLWQFRYSVARALRFPIAEELFQNERERDRRRISDPSLDPEDGIHHNLMIQRDLENGYVRLNLYRETISDVIFNQTVLRADGPGDVSTFLPIDEEVVNGAELIGNFRGLLSGRLDVRANLNYADAEVTKLDRAPALEGNVFPRMPEWRGNLLLTYHWTDRLDATLGLRYASDSFDSLANDDREDDVFGAQDAYLFTNVKLAYQLSEDTRVAFGVDNLLNEEAYVFHPWPSRTMYLELSTTLND